MTLTIRIILLALLFQTSWCSAAEFVGIVTIVDGDSYAVRKARKIQLKPGSRLFAQDLLQTAATNGAIRVESNKGGIFDLGPASLGILRPGLANSDKAAVLYLLKGWLKLTAAPRPGPAAHTVSSQYLDVMNVQGSAVLSIQADSFQVFAETGALTVVGKRLGKSVAPTTVNAGGLYAWRAGDKAAVNAKATADFIQSVPKGFQDSIPALTAKFNSLPEPAAKVMGELSYLDATPWLAAEPAVREFLVTLWKDALPADLRRGLATNIGSHPEWNRVLFPETAMRQKYPTPATMGN